MRTLPDQPLHLPAGHLAAAAALALGTVGPAWATGNPAVSGSPTTGAWLRDVIDGKPGLVDLVLVGDSNTLYNDTSVPEFTLGSGSRTNASGRAGGWEHGLAWALAAECSHDAFIDDRSFPRGRMHATALFPLNSSDTGTTGFLAQRVPVTYSPTWRDRLPPQLPTPAGGFQPAQGWPYIPCPASWLAAGQAVPPLIYCTSGEARAIAAGDPLAISGPMQVGHGLGSNDATADAAIPYGRCRPLYALGAAPPEPPVEAGANAIRLSAQCPIDVAAAINVRVVHARSQELGSFRMGFYRIAGDGTPVPVAQQVVDCRGNPQAAVSVLPVPADPSRALTGAEFRYLDGPVPGWLQGDVALFYASAANTAIESGWSVSTLDNRPGRGLRHMASDLVHAPDETLTTYFGELRARQLLSAAATQSMSFRPHVVVVIHSGINDRMIQSSAMRRLGPREYAYDGAPSTTGQGLASNLECIVERIRDVWQSAGWSLAELQFLYVPTHPTAAYGANGDMSPFAIAARNLAEQRFPDCLTVLDTSMLTTHAELAGANLYSTVEAHLQRFGYELLGRRAVQALANIVAPPTCDADLTGDGKVDGADLGALLGTWGPCSGGACAGDINRDGTVNGADLGLLMGAFGWCPP
jgi:hypothetical protein